MKNQSIPWLRYERGPNDRRNVWKVLIHGHWLSPREIQEKYNVQKSTVQKRIYSVLENQLCVVTPEQMISPEKLIIPDSGAPCNIAIIMPHHKHDHPINQDDKKQLIIDRPTHDKPPPYAMLNRYLGKLI